MTVTAYTDGSESVDIESISIESDCSNTWGIASKAMVITSLDAHKEDPTTHREVVDKTNRDIDEFIAVSGVPHLRCLFDGYGNKLFPDGHQFLGNGDRGYAVFSSRSGDTYEVFHSSIETLESSVVEDVKNKENVCVGVGRVSVVGNVVSANVPSYTLSSATATSLGGVTVLTEVESSGTTYQDYATFSNFAICSALEGLQETAVSVDDSLVLSADTLSVKFGTIGTDPESSWGRAVSCGSVYGALSGKGDFLEFDEDHFDVGYKPETETATSVAMLVDGEVEAANVGIVESGKISDAVGEAFSSKQNRLSFDSAQFTKTTYSVGEDVSLVVGDDTDVYYGSTKTISGGGVYSYFKNVSSLPLMATKSAVPTSISFGSATLTAELENGTNTEVVIRVDFSSCNMKLNIPKPNGSKARMFSVSFSADFSSTTVEELSLLPSLTCVHGGVDYPIGSKMYVSGTEAPLQTVTIEPFSFHNTKLQLTFEEVAPNCFLIEKRGLKKA